MASLLFGAWAALALGLGSLPLASAQIQGLSLKRDKLLKVVAEVNPPAAGQKSACCFSCSDVCRQFSWFLQCQTF